MLQEMVLTLEKHPLLYVSSNTAILNFADLMFLFYYPTLYFSIPQSELDDSTVDSSQL